ncbi:hypothetical protein HGO34_15890 [Agrobacterium vitis]|uniref:hypothetical protein n=1 Tax=Agrobacterium vitis TaxID=373 RepID=UPI001F29BFA4|nr:hypothetical protein [Agrobacterium vitis]MCF1498894.1 hypothetical protein [Allorhizobium sp. Av2]MCM2441204.1 hypothetical protein [Agrobacterium vitis]
MDRKALALIPIAFLSTGAACQSDSARIAAAAKAQGQARASLSLPADLPDACTALIDGVIPADGEKWVHVQTRWGIVIANRNQLAKDCGTWWKDYRQQASKEKADG